VIDPMVAAALARPTAAGAAEESTIVAAGIPFHALAWGDPDSPRVLLMHGVASSARGWWRIGPAVAAAGFRVVAPDMPGHGLTGHWTGHHEFRDTAADLAAFSAAAFPGVAPADVRVIGHSWGAMTAAAFPSAGYVPMRLILVDPPAIPLAVIEQVLADPSERAYEDIVTAVTVVGAENPTWSYGDVLAKAEALTQLDEPAVRAILTENGEWDGGLAALDDPAAAAVPVRLIRGDPAAGGLIPDAAVGAFEARIGEGNMATITGAPHSPHRIHPIETTLALMRALAN
jgi:pimeloyl-ACP methyl ester carboxylesterase